MADLWLKVEHGTPDKPEISRVARRLGVTADDAFGKFFRVWRWFDRESIDGLVVGVGTEAVDRQAGVKGFAAAAAEVGWLVIEDDGERIVMPRFSDHCGEGAKRRGLTAWRVAKHATNAASVSSALVPALPRKEKGEREEERDSNRDRSDRGQSPIDDSFSEEEQLPAFDLSDVDWERVLLLATSLGKRVAPYSPADRRQWFKFAVMVEREMFSEHWLMDSAEAVRTSKSHTKNRQAHLVAVLKSKAVEEGTDASTFRGILKRIEIPADVWKSNVLKVKA